MPPKYAVPLYVGWIATILWLSLTPKPPQTDLVLLSWDKFQHAVAYGVLALLGGFSLRGRFSPRAAWLCSIGIALALGGGVEVLQGTTSARSADGLDFLADATGAILFCLPFLRGILSSGKAET